MTKEEKERAKCLKGLLLTDVQILALDDVFMDASAAVVEYGLTHKEAFSVVNGDRDRFVCNFVKDFISKL